MNWQRNSSIVNIIIPVWNGLEHTRKCIDNIYANSGLNFKIIAIDNASDTPTKTYLEQLNKEHSNFTLIRNEQNLGFIRASNQGLKLSKSPYSCLLNNDAYVTKNWLERLYS